MEKFHPHEKSNLLGLKPNALRSRIFDHKKRADYVSERLLRCVMLCYIKHHMGEDLIGWNELGDEMHMAICEAVGDDNFVKWGDKMTKNLKL